MAVTLKSCATITVIILINLSTAHAISRKKYNITSFSNLSRNDDYGEIIFSERYLPFNSENVANNVLSAEFNKNITEITSKIQWNRRLYLKYASNCTKHKVLSQQSTKQRNLGVRNSSHRVKRQTFKERLEQVSSMRFPSVTKLEAYLNTIPNFMPRFKASVMILPIFRSIPVQLNALIGSNKVQSAISSQNGRLMSGFSEKRYCFGDIGCFTVTRDFYDPVLRPLNIPPESRERIGTNFTLFTRAQPKGVSVDTRNLDSLTKTTFNPNLPTKLIIHGWITPPYLLWTENLASALLKMGDYNVIGVRWDSTMFYAFMVLNTLVVTLEIVSLLAWLSGNMALDMGEVHLIGFSLGAQIAGYVGERVPGLGRITGLDPAGPFFQGMPTSVRLDPSDALFVDVIHTDASLDPNDPASFGTGDLSGHVDFFPNGGTEQPGCGVLTPPDMFACSHNMGEKIMLATVRSSCPFLAFPCDSYSSFRAGKCFSCDGPSGCAPMGINADTWQPMGRKQVAMYLTTSGQPDYCLYHYRFTFHMPKSQRILRSARGYLRVTLMKGNIRLKTFLLTKRPIRFEPGTSRSFLVRHGRDHSSADGALLSWRADKRRCKLWCGTAFTASHLTFTPLDNISVLLGNSSSVVMCAPHRSSATVKSGSTAAVRADPSCPRS